eukprot:1014123-Prorocentrum_minimum.AAC.1
MASSPPIHGFAPPPGGMLGGVPERGNRSPQQAVSDGRCPLPSSDWSALRVDALSPRLIGRRTNESISRGQ